MCIFSALLFIIRLTVKIHQYHSISNEYFLNNHFLYSSNIKNISMYFSVKINVKALRHFTKLTTHIRDDNVRSYMDSSLKNSSSN
jgi:hypothetical protein